jgi:glycosyltransferase involved in cell wall biosynthesis
MIKILHYGLSENRGGIETYLHKLWVNIDKKMFHFDFLDTNVGTPCFYNEFSEMGSNFFKITPRKVSIYKNKKDLEDLFIKEKYDILHCHLNTLSYITPIKVALKHGCKVIVHSRSSNSPKSLITTGLHYFNKIIFSKYINKTFRIAVSSNAGKWLFGSKEYSIINNSIDYNRFQFKVESRNEIREALNLNDSIVIGHVGAFIKTKNHTFIMKVFKEILNLDDKYKLVLVGSGFEKPHIIRIAKKYAIMDKTIFIESTNQVEKYYSCFDCFLFPSIYEGFPNAVLEAQVSGLSCYISKNITDEVIITEKCKKINLNCKPFFWAHSIHQSNNLTRKSISFKDLSGRGLTIKSEINKIESFYSRTENRGKS